MRHFKPLAILMAAFLMTLMSLQAMAAIVYVNRNVQSLKYDGKSWATAYRSVQSGLAIARVGDSVWVAQGLYKVGGLALKQGVALYGGFYGNETSLNQRDYNKYLSILDGQQKKSTVVAEAGISKSTIIDGFVITNGVGTGPDVYGNVFGGGIYCKGSPTISHNYITGNCAQFGGGIYVGYITNKDAINSPVIVYNTIIGNTAHDGGAVCLDTTAVATLSNNYISNNAADYGGGIMCIAGQSIVNNNIIALNSSIGDGGGIYAISGSQQIVNNTIVGNSTSDDADGGGIYTDQGCAAVISNNIVASCSSGIGTDLTPAQIGSATAPVLTTNCVYNNIDYAYKPSNLPHTTDISDNPMFRDCYNGDYHLLNTSTLINAGTNAEVIDDWPDIDGQIRINDGTVDIGADEVYTASDPIISPNSGEQDGDLTITITCDDTDATISYTTDGSTPSRSHGLIYEGPFVINGQQVKAIAYADWYDDSNVVSTSFTWPVAAPTFSPIGGTYASAQNVSINTTTPGATIYYTTDGSTPTELSNVYTTPINVNMTTTLKAIAVKSGLKNSDVSTALYTISTNVEMPEFSPAGGTYTTPQSVAITTATPDAVIHYTTDGTVPTEASPVYTVPLDISQTTTVRAMAVKSGMVDSSINTAIYTITGTVATPTFSPAPGVYSSAQNIVISSATHGATIRYTTDGSTPDIFSPVYYAPISITSDTTIKAIAVKAGWLDSNMATAVYSISVAGPQLVSLSPSSGGMQTGQKYIITATYADTDGYSCLNDCSVLIGNCLNPFNEIYILYNQINGKLYLRNDKNSAWLGGYAPGKNITIENNNVVVYVADTQVTKSGNMVTVAWEIAVKPTYAGKTCNVYLYTNDKKWRTIGFQKFGEYSFY